MFFLYFSTSITLLLVVLLCLYLKTKRSHINKCCFSANKENILNNNELLRNIINILEEEKKSIEMLAKTQENIDLMFSKLKEQDAKLFEKTSILEQKINANLSCSHWRN